MGLLGEHQVTQRPRGAVDAEHQHAGRHRVQRASVADLAGADQRRTRATTACDVAGASLSTTTRPSQVISSSSASRSSSSTSRGFLAGPARRLRALTRATATRLVGLRGPRPAPRRVRGRLGTVGDERRRGVRMPSCLATSDGSSLWPTPAQLGARLAGPPSSRRAQCRRPSRAASPAARTSVTVTKPRRVLDPPFEHLGDDTWIRSAILRTRGCHGSSHPQRRAARPGCGRHCGRHRSTGGISFISRRPRRCRLPLMSWKFAGPGPRSKPSRTSVRRPSPRLSDAGRGCRPPRTAVAHEAHLGVASDDAAGDHAAGDVADLGRAEDLGSPPGPG